MDLVLSVIFTVILVAFVLFVQKIRSMRKIDIVSSTIQLLAVTKIFHLLQQVQKLFPRPQPTTFTAHDGSKIQLPGAVFDTLKEVRTLKARDDDIFVITYPKSGTTWVQEIVWLICNNADFQTAKSMRIQQRFGTLELIDTLYFQHCGTQSVESWPTSKRRFIKTHLPYNLLPEETQFGKKGKFVYVARNPKDLCVSFFHFHRAFNALPDPGQWSDFLTKFCKGDVVFGDWFDHVLGYWQRHTEDDRIYFLTYERLKMDMKKEVLNLCEFFGKILTGQQVDDIVEHCKFKNMSVNDKTNWTVEHKYGIDARISKFMRKGEVGDWKNYFTINQNDVFDAMYKEKIKNSGLVLDFDLDNLNKD